jgi:hypothetical protein
VPIVENDACRTRNLRSICQIDNLCQIERVILPETTELPSRAFMPYPVSTLSPPIVPNDLSSFKARGISEVQRDLQQKLLELREQYLRAIDHFNWNKLVYEASIQFEPVVGQTYHLYAMSRGNVLSMIAPNEWSMKHLATVRLNVDRQWQIEALGADVDPQALFFHPQAS